MLASSRGVTASAEIHFLDPKGPDATSQAQGLPASGSHYFRFSPCLEQDFPQADISVLIDVSVNALAICRSLGSRNGRRQSKIGDEKRVLQD
jgi:hypothetical protein